MTPTIITNLRHAARNRETVTIGGGQFGPDELRQAATLIETACDLIALVRLLETQLGEVK